MAGKNGALEPLIGEWSLNMLLPGQEPGEDVGARVNFEWMPGKAFLIERWSVPIPEAPDGIALLGFDEGRGTFLQHYFDERGVARVYSMGFGDRTWTLSRTKEDFAPLEFSQRFTGNFSNDGDVIDGCWEISHDHKKWEKDFDLIYRRIG